MNTNTVERAERLLALGIDGDKESQLKEWQDQVDKKGPCFAQGGPPKYKGPSFTLDDLHRVFEKLHKDGITDSRGEFERIEVIFDCYESPYEPLWFINPFAEVFPRTSNHAEDLANILIWLRENNHVTAQAVNEALAT